VTRSRLHRTLIAVAGKTGSRKRGILRIQPVSPTGRTLALNPESEPVVFRVAYRARYPK
jgi:hypothetical protein